MLKGGSLMENTLSLPRRKSLRLSNSAKQLLTVIAGAVVCFGAACLLHFAWEWSGRYLPVAIFASVNESVWEHLKILSWSFLFWSIAEYCILRPDVHRLIIARTAGILLICALTVCFFFIYSGILGHSVIWVDITSAFLWLLAGELLSIRVLNSPAPIENYWLVSLGLLTLIVVMLLCFTVSAPHIGLFADPVTGLYGLEQMP